MLSHLLGEVWSPWAVGSISSALHERARVALASVGLPTRARVALASVGARFYAAEVKTGTESA